MEDREIIELYWSRSESAIIQTSEKYGRYAYKIAYAILGSFEDSEECVNDTYIKIWNSIPPQRPNSLAAYIGRIVRNLSLDKYRSHTADKRGAGYATSVLEELESCIPSADDGRSFDDQLALIDILNCFLKNLPDRKSVV